MYMHRHLPRHLCASYRVLPGENLGQWWRDLPPYARRHARGLGYHTGTYRTAR